MVENALTVVKTGDEASSYLKNLRACFNFLIEKDSEELMLKEELGKISNLFNFLRYDESGGVNEKIIIDRETGFPVITSLLSIYQDKKTASEDISKIGAEISLELVLENGIQVPATNDIDRIVGGVITSNMKEKIYSFTSRKAEKLQELKEYYKREERYLRRILYLQELLSTDLLGGVEGECEKKVEMQGEYANNSFVGCRISLAGFNPAEGLFAKYVLGLFMRHQKKYLQDLNPQQKFSKFLDTVFGHNPETIFEVVNSENDLAVQRIEKFTLGPFYNAETDNPLELQGILNGSFALRIRNESLSHEIKEYPFAKSHPFLFWKVPRPISEAIKKSQDYYICSPEISGRVQDKFSSSKIYSVVNNSAEINAGLTEGVEK
ncbi:hypothetical protein HZA33_02630 [Candidatus Pacearchaeota archaeon]|nr:hypothetical protein [Candidatus Pacearchaeota archaeon]